MGPIEIITLSVLGIFAARLVFLRGRNRVSVVVPIAVAVVGFFLLTQGTRPRTRQPAASQPVSAVQMPIIPDLAPASIQINLDGPDTVVDSDHPAAASSVRIEQTDHGNMLVLLLSSAILEAYLGPDGTAALESLSHAVSPELSRAYALVPIPGSVKDAVPGLHALATAIAQLTRTAAAESEAAVVEEPDTTDTPLAEVAPVPLQRPNWFDQPTDSQTIVKTEFEQSPELVQAQLEKGVVQALLTEAGNTVGPGFSDLNHEERSFRMTSQAIDSSIIDRFSESVDVETAGVFQRMMKTYALVRFPDDVKLQAVQHVQQSLQHQRAWTVGVTAVCLGLVVMLGAGLMQLAGSSARLVRWVGVPLVALLMLSGVAVSSQLVQRVVCHKNADIRSPFVLPDTEIDFDLAAESPEAEVSPSSNQGV